jgi:thiol-disulfide isomerase/thioredoxin
LVKDNKKWNEVTNHLFDLLERKSLFQASEYLALKLLNEDSCVLEADIAKQLETYRAMKKGNTAPDMVFTKSYFAKPEHAITKLSDLKSKYTLVVFGASWCPKCNEEFPEIATFYNNWKAKGVEVVFIGLEDDRKSFRDFTAKFPFPSYSDLKKWDSKIATDYYVFATPTMFMLDTNREILLRPISVKQVDAWITSFGAETK